MFIVEPSHVCKHRIPWIKSPCIHANLQNRWRELQWIIGSIIMVTKLIPAVTEISLTVDDEELYHHSSAALLVGISTMAHNLGYNLYCTWDLWCKIYMYSFRILRMELSWKYPLVAMKFGMVFQLKIAELPVTKTGLHHQLICNRWDHARLRYTAVKKGYMYITSSSTWEKVDICNIIGASYIPC